MVELAGPASVSTSPPVGHLWLHVEGAHPAEVLFLFEQRERRLSRAFVASFATHLAFGVLALFIVRNGGSRVSQQAPVLPEDAPHEIIWLAQPGAGGGGGGGGNKMPDPPRQAQMPGKDKITVPVISQPKLEVPQQARVEPNPVEQLNIPAKSLASAAESLAGLIEAPGPLTASQGSGSGGGAGSGSGSGIGSGRGSGLGPGFGGGTGGGAYRPGNGVSLPQLVREVKPAYTSDAMRAKIQGVVLLECVVRPDGSVTDIQVLRSLDPIFGLDQEAVKAARQWRFRPGVRFGEPVPVVITIELTFTLR